MSHLEGHSILKFIQEHLQLAHADDKVWQAELILYIPAKRPKLQPLLQITTMVSRTEANRMRAAYTSCTITKYTQLWYKRQACLGTCQDTAMGKQDLLCVPGLKHYQLFCSCVTLSYQGDTSLLQRNNEDIVLACQDRSIYELMLSGRP